MFLFESMPDDFHKRTRLVHSRNKNFIKRETRVMDIKCKFDMLTWFGFPSDLYTCQITSAHIAQINKRTIKSISGIHLNGKSDKDIVAVSIVNTIVEFFPKGLKRIFPHLIAIRINNCGLKEIARDDFKGLKNLEMIQLRFNSLTTLPSNLFSSMANIRIIDFSVNELQFVSSKMLNVEKNNLLTYVDFTGKGHVKVFFEEGNSGSVASIHELNKAIDLNFKVPEKEEDDEEDEVLDMKDRKEDGKEAHQTKMKQGYENLWTTGKLSDFTIMVDLKAFKVHKWVLDLNSSFFAKMFKSDDQVDKMRIDDLSENAVSDFLRYLYTGEPPELANAIDVFALAAKLDVPELKTICLQIICDDVLDMSNAYKVFKLGHVFKSEKLKLAAFDKIKLFFPDANLSEELLEEPDDLKKLIDLLMKYRRK